MVTNFSSEAILRMMERRTVFVAYTGAQIVGTASLEGEAVRSVFVDPVHQGLGLGRGLMGTVEDAARSAGHDVLTVPSSLTAVGFYQRLGYAPVRDAFHGDERTVVLQKRL